MWIVRLALRRPYTFVVMSILIVIFGVVTPLIVPYSASNVPIVQIAASS